jgi:hypothetical protein
MLLLRSLPRDRTKKRYNIKICSSPSLLAIQRVNYVASLANESKIVRSSRSQVLARSRDRDTTCSLARSSRCVTTCLLARSSRCDTTCLLARSSQCDTTCLLARSLAIRLKMYYCCSLVAIQHKNTIVVRHRSHPRDVTAKNVDVIASRDMTKVRSRERWHKSQMVA